MYRTTQRLKIPKTEHLDCYLDLDIYIAFFKTTTHVSLYCNSFVHVFKLLFLRLHCSFSIASISMSMHTSPQNRLFFL